MKRTTIKTLAKIAKTNNIPLLGKATDLANISFMSGYLSSYPLIDRNMQVNRGCFAPLWNRDEEDTDAEVLSQFQDDIYALLVKNMNEYQRIWDALVVAEYDPISNYDKHSVITVEHSGEDNDTSTVGARHREESYAQKLNTDAFGAVSATNTYGAVSESDTIGARSDSLTHGAQTNTDSFGAVSETTTHGAKETGTTGKRAGFNSTTLKNVEGATTNEGAQSDGHTEAARTDSHTTATYIDTNAVGAQTNNHTETERTDGHSEEARNDTHTEGAHIDEFDDSQAIDTVKKEFDSTFTTTEDTIGNIGTKDNNQLLTGEVTLRTRFKFYDIIENDIIKELCTLENDGYDCF